MARFDFDSARSFVRSLCDVEPWKRTYIGKVLPSQCLHRHCVLFGYSELDLTAADTTLSVCRSSCNANGNFSSGDRTKAAVVMRFWEFRFTRGNLTQLNYSIFVVYCSRFGCVSELSFTAYVDTRDEPPARSFHANTYIDINTDTYTLTLAPNSNRTAFLLHTEPTTDSDDIKSES